MRFKEYLQEGPYSHTSDLRNDYAEMIKEKLAEPIPAFGLILSSLGDSKMKELPPNIFPETFNKSIWLNGNKLSSFNNFPKIITNGGLDVSDNNFTSLKDIHKHITEITGKDGILLGYNPIKSNVLGLLLIKNLKKIVLVSSTAKGKDDKILAQIEKILNRHLGNGNNAVMEAQEELINAGYPEFAKL